MKIIVIRAFIMHYYARLIIYIQIILLIIRFQLNKRFYHDNFSSMRFYELLITSKMNFLEKSNMENHY